MKVGFCGYIPLIYARDLNSISDGDDDSDLIVNVYRKYRMPGKQDQLTGSLTSTIGGIVAKLNNGVFEETLRVDTSTSAPSDAEMKIKFVLITESRRVDSAVVLQAIDASARATGAVATLSHIPAVIPSIGSAVDAATNVVDNVQTFESTWNVLLQRIELFNKVVGGIAQIHPYASLAWSVISAANQVLLQQKNRDEQIVRLAGTMSDVFAFVHDADPLKDIKPHIKPLTLLIQQVTECGYFITGYAKQKDFWIRMAKYTISDIDTKITSYESRLRELRAAFLEGVILQNGVTVVRMLNVLEDTAEAIDLNDMPYAFDARYKQEKGCLLGTRESMLREICDILNDPAEDAARVCLLTGVAGSGKSAVAHSIARLFDEQKRLGSSYCFASTDVASRNPKNLFSTIARDLCDHDPQYKFALWKVVKADRALRTSTSPLEQLERLIVEPSSQIDAIGPLVIVIDALDESGDLASRRNFLLAISKQITETTLPPNLRFLITTRPESDILASFGSGPHLVRKHLGEVPEQVVDRDIEKFIHHSLHQYPELESSWPSQEWCRLLVDRSQHLFQWASTACNFIQGLGAIGLDPCQRLKLLLEIEKSEDEDVYPLDELYRTVLQQLFTLKTAQRQFREVMAVVLALKEPLPLPSLSILFDGYLNVRQIILALASLLDGVLDERKSIRPLHTSLRDFLLDGARSATFHVPILPHQSLAIGHALLTCMRRMLTFNICDLKDARIRNRAVPDLANRVSKAIPPHLLYSCLYYMDHLHLAAPTPDLDLLNDVTHFFKDFFPYWLEAISLLSLSSPLSCILSALETCSILRSWDKGHEIADLASEASQFIEVFAPVIRESTPHLYLSAMPQTPSSSLLCQLWQSHLQKHVVRTSRHPVSWPADVHTLQGHTSRITCVAYSPDGSHIISGSADQTIRIWNATTGQSVTTPLQGHTDSITSVAYSSDGKYIVSGSEDKTIRIWEATTGQPLKKSFTGHTESITSVAYSPNGRHVVSGSGDNTIRVWDVITGQCVSGPFQGHTEWVRTVAYSPDGRCIASGSYDNMIRIWDASNGQCMAGPLQGHKGWVSSIAYSPDGRHIASSSWDRTVRVWDTTTGQSVAGPFHGHTWYVTTVAYSPDGRYIVSGSGDKTLRVWDATSGQCVAGPFQRHTDFISAVAYSPDGRHFVSGSFDMTVRIWTASAGQAMAGPSKGHTKSVTSVAYAPSGRHFVSASWDMSIQVWDVTTGHCVTSSSQGHTHTITSITYSPDGRHIASGSWDGTIRVWDPTTGQSVMGPLQGHTWYITCVAYSPDGKHIVSGSGDKTIRIWDSTSGQCVAGPSQGHTGWVNSVAYSPDGKHIVSGAADRTLLIWDAATCQAITGPMEGQVHSVNSVAYAPDGKHIASGSGGGTIRVWDATTGQCVAGPFKGHGDRVSSVAYSPNGKYIVSGSWDKTIRVWNATTGQTVIGPFQGHLEQVSSVAYSPDGAYIVSGSHDCSVKLWKVESSFLDDFYVDDGWIQSSNGLCFGWLAPWNRHSDFHLPNSSLIISSTSIFQFDVDRSLFGDSWITCWQ
ncbi:WD40-repeat-containing domain protein [Chiua virens]|nr:WD40-repeat-containing domain protein [Chiua virens]